MKTAEICISVKTLKNTQCNIYLFTIKIRYEHKKNAENKKREKRTNFYSTELR